MQVSYNHSFAVADIIIGLYDFRSVYSLCVTVCVCVCVCEYVCVCVLQNL